MLSWPPISKKLKMSRPLLETWIRINRPIFTLFTISYQFLLVKFQILFCITFVKRRMAVHFPFVCILLCIISLCKTTCSFMHLESQCMPIRGSHYFLHLHLSFVASLVANFDTCIQIKMYIHFYQEHQLFSFSLLEYMYL